MTACTFPTYRDTDADVPKDNILSLLECISNFSLNHPGAYCVYRPLVIASLTDVISQYTLDVSAQIILLIGYLKGLAYLHDEKSVMHRDVNPNNLGVLSFDPLQGVLLDLDSATREEESTDHMQGTEPYLAPEVIELKRGSGSGVWPRPAPYGKAVDVWAMGLTAFALYTGYGFNWRPYKSRYVGARADQRINWVDSDSHRELIRHLEKKRVSADDDLAADLLALVESMTKWNTASRTTANGALAVAQGLVSNGQAGLIKVKAAPKRGLES